MRVATAHRRMPRGPHARGGFTIVEGAVVFGIIALLGAILLLAFRGARAGGDVGAERAMVVSLKLAVEQFKQQFGFLPPLVVDRTPGPGGVQVPISSQNDPVVWRAADLADPMPVLNSGGRRFSELSLTYYIVGTLPKDIDGSDGPGFTAPAKNGSFSRTGRTIEPLMDPSSRKTKRGSNRLYNSPNDQNISQILDYWSDRTNLAEARPIRYYRWLPNFYTQSGQYQAPTLEDVGKVRDDNIPLTAGDPKTNPGLRGAEFAIVSCGPDRLFGDEPIADIRDRLKLDAAMSEQQARAKAIEDNIVEVGR